LSFVESVDQTSAAGGVVFSYVLRRVRQQLLTSMAMMLPDGRHPRDVALLRVVAENAPVSQQWLADYLAINRSVMVKLIDGLEARGDVVRDRRPDDRRSYALRTTASGRRALKKLAPVVRRADGIRTAVLSSTERDRLLELLRVVVLPHFDPEPPEGLSDLVGFLVAHAYLRLELLSDARLAPIALDIRTLMALAVLAGRAPCSQQELAVALEIGGAATVELVDELERLEVVRRTRNPVDRRSYALEITPAGAALLARGEEILAGAASEFLASLNGTERTELTKLLAKLGGVVD
jgi:DNA-binding MarR family transcriptional regulator